MDKHTPKLLNDFDRLVDSFVSFFDLSGRSAEEIKKIRVLSENALSDRISLFILKNLHGEHLEQYNEMLKEEGVEPLKIIKFLEENIFDYENRLTQNLQDLQKEVWEKVKINNK